MKNIFILHLLIHTGAIQPNLLFIDWKGQTGNNLFQFAVAYAISKELNLNIIAPNNSIKTLFNIEYTIQSTQKPKNVFNENDSEQKFNPSVFKISPDTIISGYFQTDKYFIKYRKDLLQIISPKVPPPLPTFKINGPLICMHARGGDYLDSFLNYIVKDDAANTYYQLNLSPRHSHPVMDYDYYIRAIHLASTCLNLPPNKCNIVLISDDKNNSNFIPALISSIEKHYKNIEVQLYQDSLISEFELMRSANACITSASTFSWWAAWLNPVAEVIVSPKYWFNYYMFNNPRQPNATYNCPYDIEMSLATQKFIYSNGYFKTTHLNR